MTTTLNPTRKLAFTIATMAHQFVTKLNRLSYSAYSTTKVPGSVLHEHEILAQQTLVHAIESLFEIDCDDDNDAAYIRDLVESLKLRLPFQ